MLLTVLLLPVKNLQYLQPLHGVNKKGTWNECEEEGDTVWFSHNQQMLPAANDMINIKWEVDSQSVDPLT